MLNRGGSRGPESLLHLLAQHGVLLLQLVLTFFLHTHLVLQTLEK
jgi:hypothetical protein